MRQTVFQKLQILSGVGLVIVGLTGGMNSVAAQSTTSACTGPRQGEFLLLVVSPTPENQSQLRRALPTEINTTVCRYLGDTVTRIGGFSKVDDANGWARYVRDIVGLSAFVTTGQTASTNQSPLNPTARNQSPLNPTARNQSPLNPTARNQPSYSPPVTNQPSYSPPVTNQPSYSPPVTNQPSYSPPATNQQGNYNPQALGSGYAVLVDYANRPELATQVQQIVGGDVGFVSYAQRPFLLAVYTTNQREASTTLQTLSDRGFFAMIVDSRKVTLLRSNVSQ